MPNIPAVERRRSLIDAAFSIIARDGIAAASTRAVANEAGASLASYHYAFRSQAELMKALIEDTLSFERLGLESAMIDATDLRSTIELCLRNYFEGLKANPHREMAMLELTQYALRTPGLEHYASAQYQRYYALAEGLVDALAQGFGVRFALDSAALGRLIVVFTDGLTTTWLAERDDAQALQNIDTVAGVLMGFVQGEPA